MIRTLIEVQAEDQWKHERDLEHTVGKLGFVPLREVLSLSKKIEELCAAVAAKGVDAWAAVDEYREAKRGQDAGG